MAISGCSRYFPVKITGKIQIPDNTDYRNYKIVFNGWAVDDYQMAPDFLSVLPDGNYLIKHTIKHTIPQSISLWAGDKCVDKVLINTEDDSIRFKEFNSGKNKIVKFEKSDSILVGNLNFNPANTDSQIRKLNFDKLFESATINQENIEIILNDEPPEGTTIYLYAYYGNALFLPYMSEITVKANSKKIVVEDSFSENIGLTVLGGRLISPYGWIVPFEI